MNCGKGAFDSFRVEEVYNWRDDVMEITRRIIRETDEARLNNIAEHFEVDLSEIREFLEMKREKMQKPQTNADRIRAMTDEELAEWIAGVAEGGHGPVSEDICADCSEISCTPCWELWLRKEATQ